MAVMISNELKEQSPEQREKPDPEIRKIKIGTGKVAYTFLLHYQMFPFITPLQAPNGQTQMEGSQ